MRTDEEPRERTEQLIDAAIHRVHRLRGDESAPDAALIAHDRERQARRTQTIEQLARVRRGPHSLGIAVKRYVGDDRLVAIE